jgi:large subunit ribosomal protein L21
MFPVGRKSEMYAVIETGGKQYRVTQGQDVKVEKIPGQTGKEVVFDKVLVVSDGENVTIGKPYVDNAKVLGKLARQAKDRKVPVFKYKKRKGYRRNKGHRQDFSLVRIENIQS